MAYTTAHLLESINRRTFAPSNQQTYLPAALLAVADEETRGVVVPSIVNLREDYFSTYSDQPIVAGRSWYAIPSRAAGLVVLSIKIIYENGSVKNPRQIDIDRIDRYNSGSPDAFYFMENKVHLWPTPSSSAGTVRIYYSRLPGDLVATSATAVVSAINSNVVTVIGIPTTWESGDSFDFTKQDGGQEPLGVDYTSSNITDNDITFSSLPDDLRVGDYVSLTGETSLPQIPAEYRDVLAQAVAFRVLDDMNQSGADKAGKRLQKLLENAEKQFKPRSQGQPKIISTNHWD